MAAELKKELGIVADLAVGTPGEFTVWVDGQKVAEKDWRGFPEADDIVDAVRDAAPGGSGPGTADSGPRS